MDDEKLRGLLSQLIPDEIEQRLGLAEGKPDEQNTRTAGLLKTAAGQVGGEVENEVNEFLNGRGALLETTRSAVAAKGKNATDTVETFLKNQLRLSAPLAKLIAPLVVHLFPAIDQLAGTTTAEKPKRRRKKKDDSSSKPKPRPHKPKPSSTSKPAASHKPKPSSTSKPRPSSSKPRKKPKRSGEIAVDQESNV